MCIRRSPSGYRTPCIDNTIADGPVPDAGAGPIGFNGSNGERMTDAREATAETTAAGSAIDLARRIRAGEITAVEAVEACLARIDAEEPRVQAWTYISRELALKQAEAADRTRRSGAALGPLHGVPVGIKDIIDTADMPTGYGTPIHDGHQPREDAYVVTRLREAGAIVLGKTVTTEMAVYEPGKTRNPHHPEHTPGGSSSGSAAAVAAGMVSVALGTQTNGSVVRPAAFCGVYGYKPTFGTISRHGVLRQSPSLDQIGVFAGTLADAALVAQILMGFDSRDGDMSLRARPDLWQATREKPPIDPYLAFCKTPVWDRAEEDTQAGFAELVAALGENVQEVPLPNAFEQGHELHRTVMEADIARNFDVEYERGHDRLSDHLIRMIERGREIHAVDYIRARESVQSLGSLAGAILNDYDVILTPAVPGEAPRGLETTGSPVFCTLWTYLGLPAITIPLLTGSNGLPIGVQLVAAPHDDLRLLRTANWLVELLKRAV